MAKSKKQRSFLRIIPLGGLGEVGKNMLLLEWVERFATSGKILIIDMGLQFPGEDTPGIDFIIPNIKYLERKEKNIVGVIFTHGHYDHIGAIPYLIEKLKELGRQGILLLMSDSTGAEENGHSLSEKEIFENLDDVFKKARGRIIAATFGSLINRIQQIITLSEKYERKVAIDGYSMKTNVEICKKFGYIKSGKKTLIKPKEIQNYSDSKITLLCTGAQGEGQAVLMRIVNKEYSHLRLKKGDTVIFSSSVIPGNERTVQVLKDNILRQKRVFSIIK